MGATCKAKAKNSQDWLKVQVQDQDKDKGQEETKLDQKRPDGAICIIFRSARTSCATLCCKNFSPSFFLILLLLLLLLLLLSRHPWLPLSTWDHPPPHPGCCCLDQCVLVHIAWQVFFLLHIFGKTALVVWGRERVWHKCGIYIRNRSAVPRDGCLQSFRNSGRLKKIITSMLQERQEVCLMPGKDIWQVGTWEGWFWWPQMDGSLGLPLMLRVMMVISRAGDDEDYHHG